MKRFDLGLRIFFLTAISSSSMSYAAEGNSSGGGGDTNHPVDGAAWFLDDHKITYCVEVASDFGTDRSKIESALHSSFVTWADYISTHVVFIESKLRISAQSRLQRTCDGTEDIKFYFGGTNEEIRKAKARYLEPIAFAEKTYYDKVSGVGKGFVWIQPSLTPTSNSREIDWKDPFALEGILLHEIGHIMGCSHSEQTIMTKNIPELLFTLRFASLQERSRRLLNIDHERTLFLNSRNPITGKFGDARRPDDSAHLFTVLTGRKSRGNISAIFSYRLNPWRGSLQLGDNDGTVEVDIPFPETAQFQPHGSWVQGDNEVFRVYRQLPDGSTHWGGPSTNAYFKMVTAKGFNSALYPVSITENTTRLDDEINSGRFQMEIIVNGKLLRLFTESLVLSGKK
jgi:hypothetical protein